MFRYNVRGENIEVTEAIRDYVEKKVGKLERYFSDAPDATAHVNLKVYTEKTAKVEVTIPLPYLVLRAEETSQIYTQVSIWLLTNWNAKSANSKQKLIVNPVKRA